MRKNTPQEQDEALDLLKAHGGVPGAPLPMPGSAASPATLPLKKVGRYATATLGSATLHLFEWEVTFELETVDASAHGDLWRQPVALRQGWTGRARGYFTVAAAPILATAAEAAADPATLTFNGYKNMTASGPIWAGSCLITRCNLSVPMAMIEQEVEFIGVGVPSAGT